MCVLSRFLKMKIIVYKKVVLIKKRVYFFTQRLNLEVLAVLIKNVCTIRPLNDPAVSAPGCDGPMSSYKKAVLRKSHDRAYKKWNLNF